MEKMRLTALSDSLAETYDILEKEELSEGQVRRMACTSLICGQCEHHIIQGPIMLEKAKFQNAAFRCPRCGTALHLTRRSEYSQAVNMKRTLNYREPKKPVFMPQKIFDSERSQYPFSPLERYVPDMINEMHTQFFATQRNVPQIIYHYTNESGMLGIISDGCLWTTDLGYMNDRSELQYASNLINEEINQAKNLNPIVETLIHKANEETKQETAHRAYCAICFCPDRNRLSQWREYGGDSNGYALGFDTYELSEGDVRLRKVIYETETQREMIRESIRIFASHLECHVSEKKDLNHHDVRHFVSVMAAMLDEYRIIFKDQSFEEENEWRVIRDVRRYKDYSKIEFRNANALMIPYIKVYFGMRVRGENDTTKPHLPLLEIVRGPKLQSDLHSKTIHLLLEKYRYEHVEVAASATPLRT